MVLKTSCHKFLKMMAESEVDETQLNEVEVRKVQGKAQLVRCFSVYPLRIIRQQVWKPFISLSLMGFGGGIVAGDTITLKVVLGADCSLW